MDKNGKAIFYIEKRGEIEMQENQNNQNQEVELDENHLIQIRKEKLREFQQICKNDQQRSTRARKKSI